MVVVRDEEIDSELIINEVEKRPALYNKTLNGNSDSSLKRRLWEEVCRNVVGTVWEQLSTEQKQIAGTLVHRRWKNLRTCFTRELRLQNSAKPGKRSSKRRKYKFYEQLLFLLPIVQAHETTENAEPVVNYEEYEETKYLERLADEPSPHTSSNPNTNKSYEESLLDVHREKKESTSDMDDPEKHFALSLVPMLKALPTHRKIDAQIQILQVLRNFHTQSPSRD